MTLAPLWNHMPVPLRWMPVWLRWALAVAVAALVTAFITGLVDKYLFEGDALEAWVGSAWALVHAALAGIGFIAVKPWFNIPFALAIGVAARP